MFPAVPLDIVKSSDTGEAEHRPYRLSVRPKDAAFRASRLAPCARCEQYPMPQDHEESSSFSRSKEIRKFERHRTISGDLGRFR